jgi:hypothetical protein
MVWALWVAVVSARAESLAAGGRCADAGSRPGSPGVASSPASGWAGIGTWWSGRWRGLVGHRRLQVRYERRADILLGFVQLACALICLKQLHRPTVRAEPPKGGSSIGVADPGHLEAGCHRRRRSATAATMACSAAQACQMAAAHARTAWACPATEPTMAPAAATSTPSSPRCAPGGRALPASHGPCCAA